MTGDDGEAWDNVGVSDGGGVADSGGDSGGGGGGGSSGGGKSSKIKIQVGGTNSALAAILEHYKLTALEVRNNSPYAPPPPPFNVRSIIRWGKAGNFAAGNSMGGIKVQNASDKNSNNKKKPKGQQEISMRETGRQTHTKRVTNPQDDQQWVDVEVIDSITFDGSNGFSYQFQLSNS